MNTDTAVIVGEPMSTIPTSSSTSRPSTPISSTYTFPRPISPSDALKANPHPYPIRTTSTAVLSRSNSTASTVTGAQYQYQYYVPQSPSRESVEGKDTTKRGGRHRYSKSLVNVPKPLPAPTLFGHRNRSNSSVSSSESCSSSRSGEEEEENEDLAAGKKKRGRRTGGKVRGMVASFEGRSGLDEEGSRYYRRERAESDASSSVSSASSFGSFTDVKADDVGGDKPDSTPKRNVEGTQRREEEEPTIEELLASTASEGDPTAPDDVYGDTVKVHGADVAYSTVTASSIKYSLPIPIFSATGKRADDELSVEELLALVSNSGASAWERGDVGCTVKRVGGVEKREEKKIVQDSAEHPPDEVSPPTAVVHEREHELVQEMSETREMVRALSARVASVEAKIGEMEVVAGELEVRGRQLLADRNDDDDDGDDEDTKPPQGQSLVSTLYRTVFGGYGIGASLVRMVLPFSRETPKNRSREPSQTRAVLPLWYKRSWGCYLLFLGLGACAFVLREVVRRGMMLRGRRT